MIICSCHDYAMHGGVMRGVILLVVQPAGGGHGICSQKDKGRNPMPPNIPVEQHIYTPEEGNMDFIVIHHIPVHFFAPPPWGGGKTGFYSQLV